MDDKLPTVISFYTNNWEYPAYANKLMKSCERLDVGAYIVEVEDTGSWIGNTKRKPQFILDQLTNLKRPVLWIDVDGSLYKRPTLLQEPFEYDIALRPRPGGHARKWHVGTMYFSYNERAIKFIEQWIYYTEKAGKDGSDDRALEDMWKGDKLTFDDLRVFELPATYFQMLNSNHPTPLLPTVIAHRASEGDSKKRYMKRMRNA